MFLTEKDIVELTALRHELHRYPEISGEERETAARVVAFVSGLGPDKVIQDLGGHGLAVIYDSGMPGPTLLFRSELDALPIEELSDIAHRSIIKGKGHLCGHDGHSTILAAMAVGLSRTRPKRGRVVLLYQPAEENGAGAAAVIADPRFADIAPDFAFSLHNLPGMPLGHVALKTGPVNCASRGMLIRLTGKTAHASQPEAGISPMRAMASLMPQLTDLAHSMPPDPDFRLVTVTHARMGEAAFGIAPGEAEIWVTLRTLTDDRMAELVALAEQAAEANRQPARIAARDRLSRHLPSLRKCRRSRRSFGSGRGCGGFEPGRARTADPRVGGFWPLPAKGAVGHALPRRGRRVAGPAQSGLRFP